MEGDDRLWKINTAPVARLFQNKVKVSIRTTNRPKPGALLSEVDQCFCKFPLGQTSVWIYFDHQHFQKLWHNGKHP